MDISSPHLRQLAQPLPASPSSSSSSAPRLALFTDTLGDINGVARFIGDLAACAHAQNHGFRIFTASRIPLRPELRKLADAGLICILEPKLAMPIPGYPLLQLAWPPASLSAAVEAFDPQVIHVSTPGPIGLWGRHFATRRALPLLGTYHTDFPAYARRIYGSNMLAALAERLLDWFYQPFARVFVRSDSSAAALADPPQIPTITGELPVQTSWRSRLAVIPAGVMLESFQPHSYPPYDAAALAAIHPDLLTPDAARILFVGRLSKEKNTDFLIRIWREILHLWPGSSLSRPLQLVLVGDGPAMGQLQRSLPSTPAASVIFTGFRTGHALAALYRSADLLLFPSRTDTLGQVVLEAHACGVPAIVSDQGGPSRLVIHDQTGLVLPSTDPTSWAAQTVALLTDDPRRNQMSHAAAARAGRMPFLRTFEWFMAQHAVFTPRPTDK